jgi:N-acyl-D-amino-acid deacylase
MNARSTPGRFRVLATAILLATASSALSAREAFDVVIRGGTVYDGSGGEPRVSRRRHPRRSHRGHRRDRRRGRAKVIDARGLAVAPGFINMLSWSNESLLVDGRSQSEIRQGVTLRGDGRGRLHGPAERRHEAAHASRARIDLKYDIAWTTLAEYLSYLEKRGVSTNVASFIGAATIRTYVLGLEDAANRGPARADARARCAARWKAGAMGIGSALVYAPGTYAKTGS